MFTNEKLKEIREKLNLIRSMGRKPTKIIISRWFQMETSLEFFGNVNIVPKYLYGLPVEIGYFDDCAREFMIIMEKYI
jgi:hypothetical protein